MTNVDASRKNVAIRFILVLLGRAELTNKIVHMAIAAPEQAVLMKKRGEKLPARRSVVETLRSSAGIPNLRARITRLRFAPSSRL